MERELKECQASACLRKDYRAALLDIGKSPDSHIYDYNEMFVNVRRHRKAVRFLRKIKAFYEGLAQEEKTLFLYECLERNRHYRYWYLGQYFDEDYPIAFAQMQEKLTGFWR